MRRFLLLLAILSLGFGTAQAQVSVAPLPNAKIQFLDNNGDPLAGGHVCTYITGSTAALATYTDSSGGTPNSNPVVLDSAGRADIWLGPFTYRIELQDTDGGACAGSVIWTVDGVVSPSGTLTIAGLTVNGDLSVNGDVSVQSLNKVVMADTQAGANAGAKLAACLAAVPLTGGTCDARGLEGTQTLSGVITLDKPYTHLIFGASVFQGDVTARFVINATRVTFSCGSPLQTAFDIGLTGVPAQHFITVGNVSDTIIENCNFRGTANSGNIIAFLGTGAGTGGNTVRGNRIASTTGTGQNSGAVNMSAAAIYIRNNNSDLIEDNVIRDNDQGLVLDNSAGYLTLTHYTKVLKNRFILNSEDAISLIGYAPRGCSFDYNLMEQNTGFAFDAEALLASSVSKNYMEANVGGGIRIGGWSPGNSLIGNSISAVYSDGVPIEITTGGNQATGVSLISNTILVKGTGTMADAIKLDVMESFISGNTCEAEAAGTTITDCVHLDADSRRNVLFGNRETVFSPGTVTNEINDTWSGFAGGSTMFYSQGTVWTVGGSGFRSVGITFASLGTPLDGTMITCTDCTMTTAGSDNTCKAGGNGALALRLNGVWRCFDLQN